MLEFKSHSIYTIAQSDSGKCITAFQKIPLAAAYIHFKRKNILLQFFVRTLKFNFLFSTIVKQTCNQREISKTSIIMLLCSAILTRCNWADSVIPMTLNQRIVFVFFLGSKQVYLQFSLFEYCI